LRSSAAAVDVSNFGKPGPLLKLFCRGVEIDLMPRFDPLVKKDWGSKKDGGSCKQL